MTKATMNEAAEKSEIFRVERNILQEQVRECFAKNASAHASVDASNQIQGANT